jgi:hypothetical protein
MSSITILDFFSLFIRYSYVQKIYSYVKFPPSSEI